MKMWIKIGKNQAAIMKRKIIVCLSLQIVLIRNGQTTNER